MRAALAIGAGLLCLLGLSPASAGQTVTITFSGTVTERATPQSAFFFPLGSPIEGHFVLDLAAPDLEPLDPVLGDYAAVVDFEVRAGLAPLPLAAGATSGFVRILDGHAFFGDAWTLLIAGLDGEWFDPGASAFSIAFLDRDGDALDSPALVPVPDPARFASRTATLSLAGGLGALSNDLVLQVPEPGASSGLAGAAVALGWLGRRRGARRRAYSRNRRSCHHG